jgi:mitochondrial distribution and morphology protein 12
MSIDLEWSQLDSSLSNYLIDVLNKQLANTNRLSFIGPVEVTSLDFGSVPPEIERVDPKDIYRDFLDDENGNRNRNCTYFTGRVSSRTISDEQRRTMPGRAEFIQWCSEGTW